MIRGIAILLVLSVVVIAVVVVAKRPDQDERLAASAAEAAILDTDPDPGANASCEFAPGVSLVVLTAQYDCVARMCDDEVAGVRITHELLGGWSFRVTSGGRLGAETSGSAEPTDADPSRFDHSVC